ncbi:MAG: ATP-binding protein [Candidatus Anammoxibacter sp.]
METETENLAASMPTVTPRTSTRTCNGGSSSMALSNLDMRENDRIIDQLFSRANISPKYRGSTLDNYEIYAHDQSVLVKYLRDFIEDPLDKIIAILGSTGVGKDHLGSAVVKAFIRKKESAEIWEIEQIYNAIDGSKFQFTNRNEAIERFTKPKLLVINELSTNKNHLSLVSSIVNNRVNSEKPTMLMGNVTIGSLGAPIRSRLMASGRHFPSTWEDYRRRLESHRA